MHTSSSTTTVSTTPDGLLRKSPQIRFLEDGEDTDEGGLSDDARRVKAQLDNASWELETKDLAQPCTLDHYHLELDDFDENIVKSLAQEPSSVVNDYTSFAEYFNNFIQSYRSLFGHSYANLYCHITDNHSSSSIDTIDLPVETHDDLSTLIIQAGIHAIPLFQSDPQRNFTLVLGYNHDEKTLCFPMYRRSGLTMSVTWSQGRYVRGTRECCVAGLITMHLAYEERCGYAEWRLSNRLCLPGGATGTLYEIKEVLPGNSILEKTPCVWRIPPVQAMPHPRRSRMYRSLPDGALPLLVMGQPAMFPNSPSSLAGIGEWDGWDFVPQESEILQSCNGKFGIVEHFASFSILLAPGIPANNSSSHLTLYHSSPAFLMTNESLPAPCGVM